MLIFYSLPTQYNQLSLTTFCPICYLKYTTRAHTQMFLIVPIQFVPLDFTAADFPRWMCHVFLGALLY